MEKTNNIKNIQRWNPSFESGLAREQVEERKSDGLVNYDTNAKTKSIKQIVQNNLFTLFNFLNIILAGAIIAVGAYKNLLFLGVVISNLLISTIQEIRSKKMIDKLSLIASSKATVVRDHQKQKIAIDEIVLDDIIMLQQGNQVVTDVVIINGSCEVNESFITGESELIFKKNGDAILSGSFIMSGHCYAKVEHVGLENYTATISKGASKMKPIQSELMFSLKKVIKLISICIIPLGILLFLHQMNLDNNTIGQAVVSTVAALVGMIPEGLMLLTSMVLAVSVIRLGKKEVLVQQLYCIETLARVDVMCLDKTGTITEGSMILHDVIPTNSYKIKEVKTALTGLCSALEDSNPTMEAIRRDYEVSTDWQVVDTVPFSSERKWSGAFFKDKGMYYLGAPEFLLSPAKLQEIKKELEQYNDEYRVLILAHTEQPSDLKKLQSDMQVVAFILLRDKIRDEAAKTLEYFKKQGVIMKVISGDSVKTVSKIAKRVGIENADAIVDATEVADGDWENLVEQKVVFGRVTPMQKKYIIKALKKKGHTVAMIGDGINDVLALKESDCSVAMAAGSDAARNISELVLMDSNFDAMPAVVAEGRRSINNIERSATLFLVKTTYATLLAVIFLFVDKSYPFIPIQLTLTSMVTIGIPSFILAMEPNKKRIQGNFLINVFKRALPSALTIVFHILMIMLLSNYYPMSLEQTSTASVFLTAYVGFLLLYQICTPFNIIRKILYISMLSLFVIAFIFFRELFSLVILPLPLVLMVAILMVLDIFLFKFFTGTIYKFLIKRKDYFTTQEED